MPDRFGRLALLALLLLACAAPLRAESPWLQPERRTLGLSGGLSYDPGNSLRYYLLSAAAVYDYDRIWWHAAPEALRFKLEADLGVGTLESARGVASLGMLALYYLEPLTGESLRPYAEAGIGLIYTDFQVHDQGLRVNFNPRFGVGTEFGGHGRPWFAALRAHHLSNGDLHRDNRGINAVLLQVGRTF